MKRVWDYGTSTPIQRVGVIFLVVGLLSLFSWMIKEDLSFDDLLEPSYLPGSRDSFFFHLFFYFIPLGLLMSWGYQILLNIKQWVFNESYEKLTSNKHSSSTENLKSTSKPRQKYTTPQKNLHFKNNLTAFKFASENYVANLLINQMNVGLVQDKFELKDGSFHFLVQLASKERTTLVSGFNDSYAKEISKGNLVYWGFVEQVTDKNHSGIEAIGHVLAILYPEFNPNNGKWTVKNDLTS